MTPVNDHVAILLDRRQIGESKHLYVEDFITLRIDYSGVEQPHTWLRRDYKYLLSENTVIRERIDLAFHAYVNLLRNRRV